MDIYESIRSVLSPPHKAGHPFLIGGAAAILLGLIFWHPLAWAGAVFFLFCLYFFRDPERVPPPRPGVFIAPADGLVVAVDHAAPPPEIGLGVELRPRVGIFLSVLDVHVNRAPCAGTVSRVAYHAGRFLNAADDKASDENERNSLAVALPGGGLHGGGLHGGGEIAVVQIAGLIARRILCDATEGDVLAPGQRFGIIRFGSRTDLYLPVGAVPLVALGQRMIGGETVIAEAVPFVPAMAPDLPPEIV